MSEPPETYEGVPNWVNVRWARDHSSRNSGNSTGAEVDYVDFGFADWETDYPLNDPGNRASLIGAFETVFTKENSPYDENWDYETVDELLDWTSEQDYKGTLAISDGKVIGFSWGYRVSDDIDIDEKFPKELKELETELYDGETFMIDEVGVMPGGYRGEGIGTQLEARTVRKAAEREDISRAMQRTQNSFRNLPKLALDYNLGFEPFEKNGQPVFQDVKFVGKPGGDERIYLGQEF